MFIICYFIPGFDFWILSFVAMHQFCQKMKIIKVMKKVKTIQSNQFMYCFMTFCVNIYPKHFDVCLVGLPLSLIETGEMSELDKAKFEVIHFFLKKARKREDTASKRVFAPANAFIMLKFSSSAPPASSITRPLPTLLRFSKRRTPWCTP